MDVLNLNSGTGSPTGPAVRSGFLRNLRDCGWLSFRGRTGRKDYWIAFGVAHILLLVVARIPLVLLSVLFGPVPPTDLVGRGLGLVLSILGLLILVLGFWSLSAALVKRLHDLTMTGWLACLLPLGYLLALVPFILLGCIKGAAGPNRYGGDSLAAL